jgi:ketosteroid isomerase-like protein
MRKIVVALTITLMTWGLATSARADTVADITELEHKVANSTSADEAMSYLSPSDDVTLYDVSTPLQVVGQKAVRADFDAAYQNLKNPKVDFTSLHVIPAGKIAIAYSIQHLTATDKAGKPLDVTFRQTDVWRKEKGGWKIIHSHISYPVDMASGRAVMQSRQAGQ